MVRVPLRDVVLALAATEKDAVPPPEPVLDVVIQETLLEELQLQPVVAVTLTLPLPPTALNDALLEESE